jgi:uncharacterized protein (DUF305 family)
MIVSFHQARWPSVALLTLVLAVAPVLAGCGGSDSGADDASAAQTAPNGDVYNEADVSFAQGMIPHHAQAIEMVDMTRGRDLNAGVDQIAAQILDGQTPEIETMTNWLTAWEEEVPPTSRDHANAHDEGGHNDGAMSEGLPGMMAEEEIEALKAAPDAQFEAMWLEMMAEHHEGAIELAKTEQEHGHFEGALAMAEEIEASQSEEVEQLRELLNP